MRQRFMTVREFRREDINRLEPQPEQKHEYELCQKVDFDYTVEAGGNILAVLAYFEWGRGEYVVCSLISGRAGKYMLPLVRRLRCLIDEKAAVVGAEKIYMSVLAGFAAGERLAGILGFAWIDRLPAYYLGKDYNLYRRDVK